MKAKRVKKYTPNKPMSSKPRLMQMTWEVNEMHRRFDLYKLLNNTTDRKIPLDVWFDVHQGDLAIALKLHLVPDQQSFHIVSKVHAVCDETGSELNAVYELAVPELMTFEQFLNIEGSEPVYIDRGDGLKTRWEGFDYELENYLKGIGGSDDYKVKTNHVTLTCITGFKSFHFEQAFMGHKLMHRSRRPKQ